MITFNFLIDIYAPYSGGHCSSTDFIDPLIYNTYLLRSPCLLKVLATLPDLYSACPTSSMQHHHPPPPAPIALSVSPSLLQNHLPHSHCTAPSYSHTGLLLTHWPPSLYCTCTCLSPSLQHTIQCTLLTSKLLRMLLVALLGTDSIIIIIEITHY